MSFYKKQGSRKEGGKPHVHDIWQILLPALLFVLLYNCLQYACLLAVRHLEVSGPEPVREFIKNRPGLCLVLMMIVPMTASLAAVLREGILRLREFRRKKEAPVTGGRKGRRAAVLLLLSLSAAALCIFGNAQIQAMDLHSESVTAMQPVYREFPFLFILLIFAVVTPLAEEFVFRGLVYAGLRGRFPAIPSILVSAVLFGLYHGELIQGAYAFCMGLVLALSMEETGDIRIPWLLHGIANGLPLCLSYFGAWETFLRPGWRAAALVCFLASAGLLKAFPAGSRKEASPGD